MRLFKAVICKLGLKEIGMQCWYIYFLYQFITARMKLYKETEKGKKRGVIWKDVKHER